MEEALKSVRDAHKQELDNERYYQHQNYLALQEQIKSLEEKNKKLSCEKAFIIQAAQRKLNHAQRTVDEIVKVDNARLEGYKECIKQLDEANSRFGFLEAKYKLNVQDYLTLQEKMKSLEEKNKKLSIDWVTELFGQNIYIKHRRK